MLPDLEVNTIVDVDHLGGDVAAGIGGQETDGVGQFAWAAHPLEPMPSARLLAAPACIPVAAISDSIKPAGRVFRGCCGQR